MSLREPVHVSDLPSFDTVIDARSPSEFALDHIPGAISCPVLEDDERRDVGTVYKQAGAFEARRLGSALVARNLARHLQQRFADRPAQWKPVIYCWRGGLRSGSMVNWLRLVGWDARQLAGGYKSYRHHVLRMIETIVPALSFRVICGATGSAKTRVLQSLGAQGRQVLDLEHCASHKGSLLGALPGIPQPSQKQFETRIAAVLGGLDPSRPVFVEGESTRIGRLSVPVPLVARMRESPCIEISAPSTARLDHLLRDYAYLGDDPEALVERLAFLKTLHGKATVQRWQDWTRAGALPSLFEELLALHYDPHYRRSQERHFAGWAMRRVVPAETLTDADIERLATALAAG